MFLKCQKIKRCHKSNVFFYIEGRPNVSAEYVSNEIINCLTMVEEGIHAVLFVLSVKYGIEQEEIESTLNTLQLIFGNKILDYFIVVFTDVDQFEEENETMDDFLRDYGPGVLMVCLLFHYGLHIFFINVTINASTHLSFSFSLFFFSN